MINFKYPRFSCEMDEKERFYEKSHQDKLGYISPLMTGSALFSECMARDDEWSGSLTLAIEERMRKTPIMYGDRSPENYRPFHEITEIVGKLELSDDRADTLFNTAAWVCGEIYNSDNAAPGRTMDCCDARQWIKSDDPKQRALGVVWFCGVFLAFIPRALITCRTSVEACLSDFRALRFVPKEFRNRQVCQAARISLWTEISERTRTMPASSDVEKAFFDQLPAALQKEWLKECKRLLPRKYAAEIAEKNVLAPICLKEKDAAMFRKIEALLHEGEGEGLARFKPSGIVREELVRRYPEALRHIPQEHITRGLCELTVESDPLALEAVPARMIDERLAEKAVSKNGLSLRFVPEELRDRHLEETACKTNPDAQYLRKPSAGELLVQKKMSDDWDETQNYWHERDMREEKEREMKEERRNKALARARRGMWIG